MDREKVIKGLEMCLADEYCNGCPYKKDCFDPDSDNPWGSGVMRDAIALLKEQEEQIKNRDESLEKAREEIKWLRGMLKEQEAETEWCERCGRVRLKSKWEGR